MFGHKGPSSPTKQITCSGAHFTEGFSIEIQIWWKTGFTIKQIFLKQSLQILHMALQLCCGGMCKNVTIQWVQILISSKQHLWNMLKISVKVDLKKKKKTFNLIVSGLILPCIGAD